MYEIRIEPAVNGVIVKVGCKTFVFNDKEQMCVELLAYLRDPIGREKRWRENYPELGESCEVQGDAPMETSTFPQPGRNEVRF